MRRDGLRPAGQLRQSQVVTTFGAGAMVDLPDYSAIIGGLDSWRGYQGHPIEEERLAQKVKTLLQLDQVRFYAPPPDNDDPAKPVTGIAAWLFPEWFVAQYEVREGGVRSRPLVHRSDLDKGMRYRREAREKAVKVVPIRFVQACPRGHVSDIKWKLFVHGKDDPCSRQLWIDERGTSGDLTEVSIRCECGKLKALSAATKLNDVPLGFCEGSRPWLGNFASERCGDADSGAYPNRLLVRSASNSYFAQTLSVISIPEALTKVREAVSSVWVEYLQNAESLAEVAVFRKTAKVSEALSGLTNDEVWAEIQRRKGGATVPTVGIREAEIKTLLTAPDDVAGDEPNGDFYARSIVIPKSPFASKLERVVKVHRLREVIAQIGFTRFEAAVPDVNGELELNVERAALSRDADWLPAIENRGEGVFVSLRRDAIKEWYERRGVRDRVGQLAKGFEAWKTVNEHPDAKFPGAAFIMLHSLSHLLLTTVALDCGYAASSIRERIYASDSGYGVLLYTASPDAEGTLGGLVQAADRIDRYLRQAVDLGQLCANDPVCAQHRPDNYQEERFLHGAACHGCLLLAESSCERRNDFLDRALVVPTVDGDGTAFFNEI